MKKIILSFMCLIFILGSTSAQNNLEEVVYLKNGSIVRGTIIEQIPNQTLKIQTKDGNVFVYKFDEVIKTTKEPVVGQKVVTNQVVKSGFIDAKVITEVSSENEDAVIVQVANNIMDANGNLWIKAGTPIQCNIEKKGRKGLGKPGNILITLNSVKSVNGNDIKLNGNYSKVAKDNKGKVIGVGVGVGLFVFTPMFAYLAKKGEPAIIPANTIISNISILENK